MPINDPTQEPDLNPLMGQLGYTFRNIEYLRECLTHRSFANENPGTEHNERLEYLGDAVLQLVVTAQLFEHFPDVREGDLTRRRADFVSEPGLHAAALRTDLAEHLRLGKGEEKSGGRENPRLISSALEACFGAAYLDGGLAAAQQMGRALFAGELFTQTPGARDFKSRFQELAQAQGLHTPRYETYETTGPEHDRTFHVHVHTEDHIWANGQGASKLQAEQAAAEQAFELLTKEQRTLAAQEAQEQDSEEQPPEALGE